MIVKRRYDLDWLRVFAFGILIYFHTAVLFIPGGLPMIQNAETSGFLEIFVGISSQFRLSLLFFISGLGVAFARRRRTPAQFLRERSQRLLLPMAFGILVVVPPMVYAEKLFTGDFQGSLTAFYTVFFTEGLYPAGNLSWHHFWFIAYLYLFCLIGIAVFRRLELNEERLMTRFNDVLGEYGIYLPIILLLAIELLLRPFFPGFRDLISDWASFSHWFVVFMCGYLMANRESILDFACRVRYLSLAIAVLSTLVMYLLFGNIDFVADMEDPLILYKYIAFTPFKAAMVWCSILSCLGFAGRYFRFSNSVLVYLNEAVYPLFILHLTVIVVLGYWITPLNWGMWTKYLLISNGTAPLILLFYHFLIRPYNSMRLLFGVRPKLPGREILSAKVA